LDGDGQMVDRGIRSWGDAAFSGIIANELRGRATYFGEAQDFPVHRPSIQIGGHPDYDILCKEPNAEPVVGHITTLFVDLNRFTSRTLVMRDSPQELSEIVRAKRLWINSLIRFVHMGSGHVHSITGDGVMAFFGGKCETSGARSGKAALRTAMSVMYYTKHVLNPRFEEVGADTVRIRTGTDYSEVRWTPMGTEACSEVKAVGYGVDIAAKLLSPSKAWVSRVGETLYEQLPSELQTYLRPVKESDGEEPTFERQHRHRKATYRKYFFDWERVISDANDDADQALALLDASGTDSITLSNLPATPGLSVDDDAIIFG
jgi:class 3 adenylate cyclase